MLSRPWTLMEVCGGQTHTLMRWGLEQLLPPGLQLIHGPGCPVCVTPAATIDQALALAADSEVILCSYGDMLRVPGSGPVGPLSDLLKVRAAGGDVRLLTTPLQALALAQLHPHRQVVFLAVGFETTAPATALLAEQALALGLTNLSLLLAHVRVVPAMEAIVAGPHNQVQGFVAAGHVCAVMGTAELEQLAARYHIPVVVGGFAPQELLQAIQACVQLLEDGTPRVVNAYGRVVRPGGNPAARALLEQVFAVVDGPWRGLGTIAQGVLELRPAYRHLDARQRFGGLAAMPHRPALAPGTSLTSAPASASLAASASVAASASLAAAEGPCISAQVLRGLARPGDCPAFGTTCTPEHPLGAPMVSSEGACAAYHHYRP